MMRQIVAVVLCGALSLPGCATRGFARTGDSSLVQARMPDLAAISESVARIPVGTRLRVDLVDGRSVRGTLMHADASSILINPRARVPEPPITIALGQVRGFELDTPSNLGKFIAIGAAAGAAAALGVIMLILAIAIDD